MFIYVFIYVFRLYKLYQEQYYVIQVLKPTPGNRSKQD